MAEEKLDEKNEVEKGGEEGAKKYPYPKGVFFIITTEFCERFSYYGMKAVLALFFVQVLNFSEDSATVLYHAFSALCYFTPIAGAILADSFLGKYRTILYVSVVYAIGQIVLTIGAIGDEQIPGLPASALAFIGLFLIAFGTGGIKPCVASFGGEQFKLPEQQEAMSTYFSLFYAAINSGSLISTILTPLLRQKVSCANEDTCFPAAFGVPAALMVVSIAIFWGGRLFNLYKITDPKENIIVKTSKCIWHAISEWRMKRKNGEHKESILDYAEPKYGKSFVDDVKALKSVTYMFLPFPVFWALFDQQGSRWTFQATRMNGETFGWQILPDQMQVTNPILILGFIPIFNYGIYPLFEKLKILRTPLQRIVAGCVLASLSFYISGGLEMILEKTYPVLPKEGNMNVTFYNGLSNCGNFEFTVMNSVDDKNQTFKFTEGWITKDLPILPNGQNYTVLEHDVDCNGSMVYFPEFHFKGQPPVVNPDPADKDVEDEGDEAIAILFSIDWNDIGEDDSGGTTIVSKYRERVAKSGNGIPYVKILWNLEYGTPSSNHEVWVRPVWAETPEDTQILVISNTTYGDSIVKKLKNVGESEVILVVDGKEVITQNITFKVGGNYQFAFQYNSKTNTSFGPAVIEHKITEENLVHILWLLPQFVVMTAAEILFSIVSLEFSYTQAPHTMKAVMMSIRFLTNAFGNVINVVVISALKGQFSSQSHEFFLFASIMFADAILLGWMARSYTYVDYTSGKKDEEKEIKEKENEKEEN